MQTPDTFERAGLALALAFALLFVACRPVTVRPVTKPAERSRAASALVDDTLSAEAETALDHTGGVYGQALRAPFDVFRAPDLASRVDEDPELGAALAEVAILTARNATDDTSARLFYLQAAATAWDALGARLRRADLSPADPLTARLIKLYNRAVGRWLDLHGHASPIVLADQPMARGTARITIFEAEGAWDASTFDALESADGLRIDGVRQRYRRYGLGAALVGRRNRRPDVPEDRFLPQTGAVLPVTALLTFEAADDTIRRAVLHLFDPSRHESFTIFNRRFPLAADFTAPYAVLLSQGRLDLLGYGGMLRPQRFATGGGIRLLEPYDPHKTPVLMIHGLLSSPLAFADVTNGIWGDDHLRRGFQVWHYMYPSGLPFLWAASDLRAELTALRSAVDPDANDPAWEDLVVIAHSMGGLVARTLARSSGDRLWRAVFRVRASDLDLTPERREALENVFFFERLPSLHRVVFLATPHRGAERAESLAGKALGFLIKLPREMRDLMRAIIAKDQDAVDPSMRKLLAKGGPSSIHALRPSDPMIRALADLPPHPSVHVHQILGDRGRGDGVNGSDGYVPYASAHLENAESEVIVPTGHSVYEHRNALAEIRRILHRHLGSVQETPGERP